MRLEEFSVTYYLNKMDRDLRDNKSKGFTFFTLGCLLSFTLMFCTTVHEDDHGGQEQAYRIVENADNLEDCSVYSMVFDDAGDYAFRFALSGKCPTLNDTLYLNYYTNFLKKYKDSIHIKNGQLIQLNFYKQNGILQNTIEKITLITTDLLKKQVAIKEFSEEAGIAVLSIQ